MPAGSSVRSIVTRLEPFLEHLAYSDTPATRALLRAYYPLNHCHTARAQCQLGGLIYFTLLGFIVLVLINFLPLVNLVFQLLFDGCVACVDAVTEKRLPGKLKKPSSLCKAPTTRIAGRGKGAGKGAGTGASASAGDVSDVNLTAQQLRALKRRRRLSAGPDTQSFASRARLIGRRVARHFSAAPSEEASLLPQTETVSPQAWP